jgi:hypothetical protein
VYACKISNQYDFKNVFQHISDDFKESHRWGEHEVRLFLVKITFSLPRAHHQNLYIISPNTSINIIDEQRFSVVVCTAAHSHRQTTQLARGSTTPTPSSNFRKRAAHTASAETFFYDPLSGGAMRNLALSRRA